MNGMVPIAEAGPYPYTSPHDGNAYRIRALFHRPARSGRPARRALGVAENRIYTDHGLTGTTRARPCLDQALAAVRAGDTLVVPNSTGWPGTSQMLAPSPIGFGNAV